MIFRTLILLVHCLLAASFEMKCKKIPGRLKQIDAGNNRVFGVTGGGLIYARRGETWSRLPSRRWKHVSVGRAGVLGVQTSGAVYQLVEDVWRRAGTQQLKQVDAGSWYSISGVEPGGKIVCRQWKKWSRCPPVTSSWTEIQGTWTFKYISCGTYGCWAVRDNGIAYFREGSGTSSCYGTAWKVISGMFTMVEVASNGKVFGVTTGGILYRRYGITYCQPHGLGWVRVGGRSFPTMIKHVSMDNNHLWVIDTADGILDCTLTS